MVEGKAIRLHPLVTSGFNADFDGDTMAVHLPLCEEAVNEARHLLLASKQIIAPKDGRPVITPTIDMLVGVYYVTTEKRNQLGEGTIFGSVDEVKRAYAQKLVDLHALVGIGTNCYSEKGLGANNVLITTVGKILFNEILPADMKYVNSEDVAKISNEDILKGNIVDAINERKLAKPVAKANLSKIITMLYENYDINTVARTADAIKDIGFEYATKSGTTFSIFDFPKYSAKEEYIRDARERVAVLKKQHNKGLLTEDERYLRVIEE
jgi:DNA-directed RNA polymerase subunit beta'